MTVAEYYQILGLTSDSSVDDIKKAYRIKARAYHPDLNHSPEAKDLFIKATEAYEFLMTYNQKLAEDEEEFHRIMEEWRKYRRVRSRERAQAYAGSSYVKFKKTNLYKSTKRFDGASIIANFILSILVFAYTIFGFFYRLKHPYEKNEKPPVFSFILLLTLSIILFSVSFIYLKAYLETTRKNRKKK